MTERTYRVSLLISWGAPQEFSNLKRISRGKLKVPVGASSILAQSGYVWPDS